MSDQPTPETDAAIQRCACADYIIEPAFARTLERQQLVALAALEDIANMPEHDQDDSHRLRHKARAAIAAVKGEA